MKAASEREAKKWFGDRTTIIRPTLIVGPGDDTFRFTYWPYRIGKGGEILAPGDGQDQVQIVDGRDLAEWTIRVVENGTTGTFNAAGPTSPLTMAEQLYGIRSASRPISAVGCRGRLVGRFSVVRSGGNSCGKPGTSS